MKAMLLKTMERLGIMKFKVDATRGLYMPCQTDLFKFLTRMTKVELIGSLGKVKWRDTDLMQSIGLPPDSILWCGPNSALQRYSIVLYVHVHIPLGPENRQDNNRADLYTLISRCYDSLERRVTLHSKLLSRVGPLKQHPATNSPQYYRENQDAGPNSYLSALRRSSQLDIVRVSESCAEVMQIFSIEVSMSRTLACCFPQM